MSSTPSPIPRNTTFVGNTPSAVLFFLAMAVGVAIAALFVFFTVRYFIRSKYGLHIYSLLNRGMLFAPRVASRLTMVAYSDREIYEHLDYLRTHHFLRDDFLERRLYTLNARRRRRRRRRRRGRFSKMKKLSPQEVEKLFPQCLYAAWLHDADLASSKKDLASSRRDLMCSKKDLVSSKRETDLVLHTDLEKKREHFDSGLCSICLESFELDDTVRGLICGHVYHSECVDPWLTKRRACCPICKRDYYSNETGPAPIIQERDESGNEDEVRSGEAEERDEFEDGGEREQGNGEREEGEREEGEREEGEREEGEREEGEREEGEREEGGEGENGGDATVDGTEVTDVDNSNAPHIPHNNGDNTSEHSIDDLNYEFIRGDSNLQALFNELVPISERVRVILDENPDMDLDNQARAISRRKYGTMFKLLFWRIMGITRDDLYYYAVLKTFLEETRRIERERENGNAPGNANENANGENGESATDASGVVELQNLSAQHSAPPRGSTVFYDAHTQTSHDLSRHSMV